MDGLLVELNRRLAEPRNGLHYTSYEVSEKHKEKMKVLAPYFVAREHWTSHKRWHSQPQMPSYHVHFRQEMQIVMRQILNGLTHHNNQMTTARLKSLKIAWDAFETSINTLGFHVRIEEGHYFPQLIAAFPDEKEVIRSLYDDHAELHRAEDKVKKSFHTILAHHRDSKNNKKTGTDDTLFEPLIRDFLAFDKTLMNHLGEEEEIVVPLGLSRHVDF